MHGQDFIAARIDQIASRFQRYAITIPSPPRPALLPRPFDEDPPHGLSRGRKEVSATVPILGLLDIH